MKSILETFREEGIPDDVTMMRPQGLYIGVKENDETDLDEIENPVKLDDAHENDELFTQFEDDLENGATETNHAITFKLDGKEM